MSHTMANSAPPPRQCPCIAAMVTFFVATSARITAWNLVNISSTLSGVWAATSTPAENAVPWPLTTIMETSGRDSISASDCASSSIMGMSMMFSGGRRSTIRATEPSTSSETLPSLASMDVVVMCELQVDRRLPYFADGRERVARSCLLRDPFLLVADDVEQKFLVFRRRHVIFHVLFVGPIVQQFA